MWSASLTVHVMLLFMLSGNIRVWHGDADILLDHSVVKIELCTETDVATEDYSSSTLEYQEPPPKKTRLDSSGSGDAECSRSGSEVGEQETLLVEVKKGDNNYMPQGPKDINIFDAKPIETLSQVLAQTIVNAFLQVKQKETVNNYFIPSFLASDKYVTIHMYNPVTDVLLTQGEAMALFREDGKHLLPGSILSIWMALNMGFFSEYSPFQALKLYEKSLFHSLVPDHILEIYKEELTMPLGTQNRPYRIHVVDCEDTSSYVHIVRELDKLNSL